MSVPPTFVLDQFWLKSTGAAFECKTWFIAYLNSFLEQSFFIESMNFTAVNVLHASLCSTGFARSKCSGNPKRSAVCVYK